MTLCLKTLINKVGSCDFRGIIEVVDNWDRFNDDQYKN